MVEFSTVCPWTSWLLASLTLRTSHVPQWTARKCCLFIYSIKLYGHANWNAKAVKVFLNDSASNSQGFFCFVQSFWLCICTKPAVNCCCSDLIAFQILTRKEIKLISMQLIFVKWLTKVLQKAGSDSMFTRHVAV